MYYSRSQVEAGHSMWQLPFEVFSLNPTGYSCGTIQHIENIPLNAYWMYITRAAELKLDTEFWQTHMNGKSSTWPYNHAVQFNILKTFL